MVLVLRETVAWYGMKPKDRIAKVQSFLQRDGVCIQADDEDEYYGF